MPQNLKRALLGVGERNRSKVVMDCTALLDQEVADKRGLTGIAIKAAYAVVKALKPGIIPEAMNGLLDEFISKLEPFFERHLASGGEISSFGDSLNSQNALVTKALLGITDQRAEASTNATLRSAYGRLRGQAEKNVSAAIPGVARMVDRIFGA